MRIWREGDQSAAICERCERRVETRFEYRTFDLDRPRAAVPDVLVAVCGECGEIASIPYQSTPRIQQARDKEMTKFEARVPLELEDALGLIAAKLAVRIGSLTAPLIRYYLRELGRKPGIAAIVKELAGLPLAQGPSKGRVSVNIDRKLWEGAWVEAKKAGIKNKAEVARGLILAATIDTQAGDVGPTDVRPSTTRRHALEAIAAGF